MNEGGVAICATIPAGDNALELVEPGKHERMPPRRYWHLNSAELDLPDGKKFTENVFCDNQLGNLVAPVLAVFWAVGIFGATT